jgi:hypothetical protein
MSAGGRASRGALLAELTVDEEAARVIGRAALAPAMPLVTDSLTAAAAQRGLVIQLNVSGGAAPGVR